MKNKPRRKSRESKVKEDSLFQCLSECNRWTFTYVTNSIILRFFDKAISREPRYWFWIEPPWEIMQGTEIIQHSSSCPIAKQYKQESDYKIAFERWCNKTQNIKALSPPSVELLAEQSLKFLWENGFQMMTVPNSLEEETWTFYDEIAREARSGFLNRIETTPIAEK